MSTVNLVDAKTLKKWLDAGDVVLIDVRETDEYREARIPGSFLVPLNSCNPDTIKFDTEKKLVFHCRTGGRSGKACTYSTSIQPEKQVWNLEGGIMAWMAVGLPVERG